MNAAFFTRGRRATVIISAVTLWLAVVGFGMKTMLDYQSRPGASANAPVMMPALASSPAGASGASGRPTLIFFAHPRCPCTRASLSELDRIMARTRGRLQARVLFVVPPGKDAQWARTHLLLEASAIPNVEVVLDPDGVETARFGAFTSGQALLYDERGRLQFAGGVTPGRGHAGDNAGSDAIVSIVNHTTRCRSETPVFGCQLAASSSNPERGPPCPK